MSSAAVVAASTNLVQLRLIKAIVLGGVCSIISMDAAEVVFACLDPVVDRVLPKKGANVVMVTTAEEAGKKVRKQAQAAEEARKVMVKRIIRILLFTGIAYLMTSFIVDRLVK